MMAITVIIPTLKIDEELRQLLKVLPKDVIIVNGGTDTYSIAEYNIINTNPGRGYQMAAGANFAKGEWLYFLHGDSKLTTGWWEELQKHMKNEPKKAMAFRLKFDDDGFFPRLLEKWVRFRCWAFALPYGDQGLFISRELYDEIGGYSDMPLMEDVDIVKRIGRTQLKMSDHVIITSAEKYNKYGYLFRMLQNGFCLLLYKLGVTPITIKKFY